MVYLLFQLTSLVFVEGTPVGPCDDFTPLSGLNYFLSHTLNL